MNMRFFLTEAYGIPLLATTQRHVSVADCRAIRVHVSYITLLDRPVENSKLAYLDVVLLCLLLVSQCLAPLPAGKSCFCQLYENVDECACSVDSVDDFNNNQIYHLLQQLLQKSFFRFYEVDLSKECPFWQEDRECGSRECGIEHCDDEVPAALKEPLANKDKAPEPCDQSNTFDPLDTTLSQSAKEAFKDWAQHDDAENKFCDFDDDVSLNKHYVDLSRNPERYTGYKGNSAQRVWMSIYRENCFKPNPRFDKDFLLYPSVTGLCLEKRVFFRLMSGLHTSITISIAAHNYKEGLYGQPGTWVRNLDMFKWRFSPETTGGEGPQRLKNLYFVYLMELRALHKVAPYLSKELFYTGDEQNDQETREMIEQLMKITTQFPSHFDETAMFQGVESLARELKEEFRQHFLNISRIMDCVGCDKCRLWGKIQTHGMGAALKILFSDIPSSHYNSNTYTHLPFQLTRNQVVALFQSFGRYASSIREVAEFRRLLDR